MRERPLILRGATKWNKHCDALLAEMKYFLLSWDKESSEQQRHMRLYLEAEG